MESACHERPSCAVWPGVGGGSYDGGMAITIGAHVDQTDPIAEAQARQAALVQFFLGDPQGYKGPEIRYSGGTEGLKADAEAAGVDLYVHAPYIVNVATTNNRIRIPSRKLLQQHVDAAAAIGAKGLIVHGGHVNNDDDPAKGFDNWRKAIEATDLKLPLLIENTAGGDNAMARYLDRIKGVWDALSSAEGADRVGFCLDTCHAHAGGNALETVVADLLAITGRIDLVHCNDSRDEFDSGADRHANVGQGKIDPDLLAHVVREAGVPVVFETPGGAEEHRADFEAVRSRL
jgi:deoxyribonuclease IV